ncbi:TetR/AcrR family transcriptional regulator [Phocaeicola faecalis]
MKEEVGTTEQAILKAAEKEFLKKGFSGSKTIEIAKAAGVTHAMLHYYFRTKENLFNTVFEEKAKELAETMLSHVDESLPFPDKLKASIESHFNLLASNPELPLFIYKEILANDNGEEVCKRTILPKFKLAAKYLEASLNEEIAKGAIRPIMAEELLISAISLNVFVFVGNPLIRLLLQEKGEDYHRYLERRKQENVETILSRLRI